MNQEHMLFVMYAVAMVQPGYTVVLDHKAEQ
ncbi:unnamed protein product [Trichobilharzia regenti]|nr:unnamed protein product [Trichobilharzia regenti]